MKYTLLILGTVIISGTTFVFAFVIPTMNFTITNFEEEIEDFNRLLELKTMNFQNFELTEMRGINLRNTLIVLESLNLQDSQEYNFLETEVLSAKLSSLIYLAAGSGIKVTNDLESKWKRLDFQFLEQEKSKYVRKFEDSYNSAQLEKRDAKEHLVEKRNSRSKVNIYGATAQVIALLLLGWSELLIKRENKVKTFH